MRVVRCHMFVDIQGRKRVWDWAGCVKAAWNRMCEDRAILCHD